jgi:hypothetical protein
MSDLQKGVLDSRMARLERRLRFFELVVLVLTTGLMVAVWMGLRPLRARADDSSKILRVRGLIVEDASGRARILLGAPVPKVKDRRRTDDAIGLIVLGENGAERVAVGYPTPAPQIGGHVEQRITPASGIVIDDLNGNERGGFGFLDNDRVVLGLDYPGCEAVTLAVVPEWGFAGLTINAPHGSQSERAEVAVLKDGTSMFKLADITGTERAMLVVQDESPAKLLGISPKDKSTVDVGISWLNPSRSKHVVVKSGERLLEDLGKLKP